MKSKKKKAMGVAASLAILSLVSGTFAWLNSQDQRINRLESLAISDGSVQINEIFNPQPIQANGQSEKKVSVTNGGSAPVYVRVSFEEVLKYLASGAVETPVTTAWQEAPSTATPAEKSGVGRDLPVEINPTKGKYSSMHDITSKVKATSGSLPSNLKVIGLGTNTYDPGTNKYTQTFDYAMYSEFNIGSSVHYQKVSGSLIVVDAGTPTSGTPTTETDWEFSLDPSTIQYLVYSGGYKLNVVNWAAGVIPGQDGDGTADNPKAKDGAALIGAKGARYGKTYDYRPQSAKGIIPDTIVDSGANPHLITTDYPAGNSETYPIQSATDPVLGGHISLSFNNALIDNTALSSSQDGKWVYNPEDGWFYFTNPLGTGNTTPNLLETVNYDSKIDKQYSNATLDFDVKIEAMQYVKEALTDKQGFGLNPSGISGQIEKQLEQAKVF